MYRRLSFDLYSRVSRLGDLIILTSMIARALFIGQRRHGARSDDLSMMTCYVYTGCLKNPACLIAHENFFGVFTVNFLLAEVG